MPLKAFSESLVIERIPLFGFLIISTVYDSMLNTDLNQQWMQCTYHYTILYIYA